MAADFYADELAHDMPFQMTALYARPGWYVRLGNSTKVLGPFDDRDSALEAAARHRGGRDT